MFAPIYRTLNTPAVRAIVGDRIYGKGTAPQNAATPYITWFVVTGDPYANLSEAPDSDNDMIQIDCWTGPQDDQEIVCNNLALSVRAALDAAGQVNRIISDGREKDTRLFRVGLQVDFIHNR